MDLLADMEDAALDLETDPENEEPVARIFRDVHTIKGSGAMFGYEGVARFAHRLESLLELARRGEIPVDRSFVDLVLASRDQLKSLLETDIADPDESVVHDGGVAAAIDALIARHGPHAQSGEEQETLPEPASQTAPVSSDAPDAPPDKTMFLIHLAPSPEIMQNGLDPRTFMAELGKMGQCFVSARTKDVPPLRTLDPEKCHLSWEVLLSAAVDPGAVEDVFIFLDERSRIDIQEMEGDPSEEESLIRRMGSILIERGHATPQEINRVLSPLQEKIGRLFHQSGIISTKALIDAVKVQRASRERSPAEGVAESLSSVRVPSDRLDRLVDVVGEIGVHLSHLKGLMMDAGEMEQPPDPEKFDQWIGRMTASLDSVHWIAGDLRDLTMSMRMLPLGTLFGKFRRLVRDLSAVLGKGIELETAGGDTELDKSVIEGLGDPLMHLVRNSADHGVEPPEERERAGKPRRGTIRLNAVQRGPNVVIEVADDGRGIDAGAIRAAGAARGLIREDASFTDADLAALICTPGLSTAERISDVSGRGVGMDVVQRSIEKLRGSIAVAGEPGLGCRVTLTLPLTLAISDGMLVEVGGESYMIPLSYVDECIDLTREMARSCRGAGILPIRGQAVPCLRLADAVGAGGTRPERSQIVVVRNDGERFGIVVDHILGTVQAVVKPLDRYTRQFSWVSGGTILGDGRVALILDIVKLWRLFFVSGPPSGAPPSTPA